MARPSIAIETHSIPSIKIMSSPTSPTSTTKFRRQMRDTGFPEPLDGARNTTLPHPDADLSPNACISQDDITVDRSTKRSRRSFLRKHRRTVSHGFIDPRAEATQSTLTLSLVDTIDTQDSPIRAAAPRTDSVTSSVRVSKEDADSIDGSMGDRYTPPTSPDIPTRSRRKSLLRKWRGK